MKPCDGTFIPVKSKISSCGPTKNALGITIIQWFPAAFWLVKQVRRLCRRSNTCRRIEDHLKSVTRFSQRLGCFGFKFKANAPDHVVFGFVSLSKNRHADQ